MAEFRLSQSLSEFNFLNAKECEILLGAGIATAEDLLRWLPKRYEDRRRFDQFPTQATLSPVCLRAKVIDAKMKGFGGAAFFEVIVESLNYQLFDSGTITVRWFHMPFMKKVILAGAEVILYGKVKELQGRLILDHPDFEVIKEDNEANFIHLERVVPVYKNIVGIAQRRLRELIFTVLKSCDLEAFTWLHTPDQKVGMQLLQVHFPDGSEEAITARRDFALEHFFIFQLRILWKRKYYSELNGRIQGKKTTLLKQFYHSLPFDLTGAQKRCIRELAVDMREPRPMHRLIQGDVGAGKTFVAIAACLLAIDSGAQAAIMVPTQILAEQHFITFKQWLEPLGVRVALLTASRDEGGLDAQVVIGTHALLFGNSVFRDLGLVVIDEQHKFGVEQRSKLISQGVMPDVLVMTATPIPRSLTMTAYGDLDLSVLDEKPPGRGTVVTGVRVKPKSTAVTSFIKEQIDSGRQIYLVYPLVDDASTLKVESAKEAFEKWQKRLSKYRVGLMHGKLKAEEKQAVMESFRAGDIQVLVTTTVIEVGVDVPNASVMIIHHAERFGLAQLHQLRGRVGRGGHKGYCVLLTDGKSAEGMEKLRELEKSNDGFVIAEADLRLRGPGDVMGVQQSGLGDMKFIDLMSDMDLLLEARQLAVKILQADPLLSREYHHLQSCLITDEARVVSTKLERH